MNGVIEKSTGDLIRVGYTDFTGTIDPALEEIRTDVPEPGKVRHSMVHSMMHRWTGSAWVEVGQPGQIGESTVVTANMTISPFVNPRGLISTDATAGTIKITIPDPAVCIARRLDFIKIAPVSASKEVIISGKINQVQQDIPIRVQYDSLSLANSNAMWWVI